MTRNEGIEYLMMFPADAQIGFAVSNPSSEVRKQYPVTALSCISDMGYPVFALEVGFEESLDDETK